MNKIVIIFILYVVFVFYLINTNKNRLSLNKIILENEEDLTEKFNGNGDSDNKNIEYIDSIDKLYAKLYNLVFDEKQMFKYEFDLINKFIKNKVKKEENKITVLDLGTGVGRHYELFNERYNTHGLDKSRNMLDHAFIRNPVNKIKIGDLKDDKNFSQMKFDVILCLKDTLYHNSPKDWDDILSNIYYWLKPNGYFVIHLFNKKKIDPAPRNHSQYNLDSKKIRHAITHFKNFTHDAWWKKKSPNLYEYNEIFAFRNKSLEKYKKKYYRLTLYFPEKERIINKIKEHYFNLVHIDRLDYIEIYDHEIFYFKKPSKKINIL